MKTEIHPQYGLAHVHCSCGNEFLTRSTRAGDPRRDLLRLPPLLHRQAEAGRHRRPSRALQAQPGKGRRQEVASGRGARPRARRTLHGVSADADRAQAEDRPRADRRLHGRRGRRRHRSPARWRCSPTRRTCSPTPWRSRCRCVAIRLAARPAAGRDDLRLAARRDPAAPSSTARRCSSSALLIVYEGIRRLIDPPGGRGRASCSPSRSLGDRRQPRRRPGRSPQANRESLNVEGAYQHILTDLAAFVFTAIAGAVILATGFDQRRRDRLADRRRDHAPRLLRAAARLGPRLPRGGARGASTRTRSARAMAATPGVVEVHDLHVWEVTSGFPALSAHVTVGAEADCHAIRLAARARAPRALRDRAHDPPGRPPPPRGAAPGRGAPSDSPGDRTTRQQVEERFAEPRAGDVGSRA